MNLPEYLGKVLDIREYIYEQTIQDSDITNPDEAYAADEAVMRIREIQALRKGVLARHNTWRARYPTDGNDDDYCVGCACNILGDPITRDINDCPELRALAEPYSDRSEYGTWS